MAESDDVGGGAFIGVLLALLACFNSSFAGVYSELLLKKDGNLHSIHLQNILLYSWGVVFNGIAVAIKDQKIIGEQGVFGGYTFTVWMLVLNNALNGLAISAILKFADNIVRVFAHTASMVLTMALEVLFLDEPFSPELCVAVTIVACSTYLYSSKPPPQPVAETPMQQLKEVKDIPDTTYDMEFKNGENAPDGPPAADLELTPRPRLTPSQLSRLD